MEFNLILFNHLLHQLPNNFEEDNYDHYRFGPYKKNIKRTGFLKSAIVQSLNKFNYYNRKGIEEGNKAALSQVAVSFERIMGKLQYFEYLYHVLENEESKELLLKLVAYRILGYRKVKLPVNTPDYWEKLKNLDKLVEANDKIDIQLNYMTLELKKFNLNKIGYPISIYFNNLAIQIDFVLEQYAYSRKNQKKIEVEEGDVVIDGGGCYGDTALYFAHKAGKTGKVHSFEFIPENIAIFRKNCALNPLLEAKIELVQHPLWSKSNVPVYYQSDGPGSKVSFEELSQTAGKTTTVTIDDYIQSSRIEKVDFIKMDIEGAELDALQGSVETIKKHKPKLAICVYHSIEDFGNIPKFINELKLGYKFYLGHYTIYQEETVLFAIAE
jgi:FkbM family methyltransferase